MKQQTVPIVKPIRTMLICAAPHTNGRCSACGKPIVWVFTQRYARHPLDTGFAVLEQIEKKVEITVQVRRIQTLLRVPTADSHFATCPFADRFKKKRREQ